jgi:DNA polymerase III delta prime subunit
VTAPAWEPTFGDVDINGDHAQNAVGNYVSRDLIQNSNRFVRGQPAMYLGSEEIEDRVRCYVAAGNHDLIVKALELDHAVTLVGPPGCGRETTAIAAINQLRSGIRIRRFSLEDEDAEEIHANGGGYLVRAAGSDRSRLGNCVDAVRASGGYLVVISDAEAARTPTGAYPPPITVEPPHSVQVYRHRVTVQGLTEWWHWDEAPVLLEHARPADARRLTGLIEQIAPGGGDLAAQQAEVLHAYRGWKDELCVWFDDHPEPHERALLVAAAALSPADEANVYTIASSLARRLEITMNGAGLAWCPVTRLRDLLRADDENGRIVFRRHGFARSVLRHALTDYPLVRSDLLAWLAALPTDDAVPHELRNSFAGTFADLAAEHGPAELITETARTWGADDLADLAFTALSRTCLHPRVGGAVRRALYEWSYKARTPQTLKLVIARVCEPLGQTYPSIALTRLKHLATHGNRQVLGEVILAAQALATSNHPAEVLAAALDWCAETNPENLSPSGRRRRRRAGAMLFLELARPVTASGLPELLDGDRPIDPMRYERGWRAALESIIAFSARDIAFEDVARQWLDAALQHSQVRHGIVRVFVEAAKPSSVPTLRYGATPAKYEPTAEKIMIGVVRYWAAADRMDPIRKAIKEGIVIPLTRSWWLRLLKIIYVWLRTLIETTRAAQ